MFINKKQNDYLRAIYFISISVLTEEKNSGKLDRDCLLTQVGLWQKKN